MYCSTGETRKCYPITFFLFPSLLYLKGTKEINTTIGKGRGRCYRLCREISHLLFTSCSSRMTTYNTLGNEMSHNRIRVNYPILASELVQRNAFAGVSDFSMSVADNEVDDETLLREHYRMLKVSGKLLRVT